MFCRIIQCIRGEFIVLTETGQTVSLQGIYGPSSFVEVGDFIHTSNIGFNELMLFYYVEFIRKAEMDEILNLSPFPDYFLPCINCMFRNRHTTGMCNTCDPKKISQ